MKLFRLFLLVALSSTPVAVFAQSSEVKSLMTQAQRSMAGGDRATAKALFARVVELDPNNANAKRYLRTLELAEASAGGTGGALKVQLERLMVEKIDFKETSLDAVLEFLSQVAKKKSMNLSFVQKLPADYAKNTKINLNLSNVPMSVVLQYVGTLSNTVMKPEQYAVTVELASAQAPAPAANGTPEAPKIQGL